MEEKNEDEVQRWLDQRQRPREIPTEQKELFLQYDMLEKRLCERRLPSAPASLCRRTLKKNSAEFKTLRIALAAAIVLIALVLWGRDFPPFSETKENAPPKEVHRAPKRANKVEPMPVDKVPEYVAELSRDFVADWRDFCREKDFSTVLYPTQWNFAGQSQTEDAGNEIKERVYDVFTKVNYFLERYTVAGSGGQNRRG